MFKIQYDPERNSMAELQPVEEHRQSIRRRNIPAIIDLVIPQKMPQIIPITDEIPDLYIPSKDDIILHWCLEICNADLRLKDDRILASKVIVRLFQIYGPQLPDGLIAKLSPECVEKIENGLNSPQIANQSIQTMEESRRRFG
jgi:hypothetical protein